MSLFQAEANGKWILAGEHAVLRGSPALVFPLHSRKMKLEETRSSDHFAISFKGQHGTELEPLFWTIIERACDLVKIPRAMLSGQFVMESNIPLGAGLGASAAFCVVVAKWFSKMGFVGKNEISEFARTLENLFHGESSGVDISVALSGQGLHYERNGRQFSVSPRWKPNWFISYTGERGMTSDAVKKVKDLLASNPQLGRSLDEKMQKAVEECEAALRLDEAQGFQMLVAAIKEANLCFEQWGLTEGAVRNHSVQLLESGAVAVKPTGSGGGGYVLSLWSGAPPEGLRSHLIEC